MIVQLEDVTQWLEPTKFSLESVDPGLAETASARVLGALSALYDTSGWTNETNTPTLVRKMVGALVAAWLYNRQYAEDVAGDPNAYGNKLESLAMSILADVAGGSIDLTDASGVISVVETSLPSFWPTDQATTSWDEFGDSDLSAPRAFTMGSSF